MDFNYTFHYRLSYQEAYDTFYLLATRLTRKKKIIYGILLTAIAVLSLVFYGLDTRKVHLCLLAIFAAVLLFYLLYYPVFSARKGLQRSQSSMEITNSQSISLVRSLSLSPGIPKPDIAS